MEDTRSGASEGPADGIAVVDDAARAFLDAVDRVSETQRAIDALHARQAREILDVVRAADRLEIVSGTPTAKTTEFVHRSTRAELALALGVSERTAERALNDALALTSELTATLEAVEAGRATWRAATLIVEHARGLGERTAEFEARALELADFSAASRLGSRLAALRDRMLETPAIERHAAAREERRVVVEDVADGMSWLHAYLPSVEAHAIAHRLTDIARRARDIDDEEGIDDRRTLDQRRADLLVDFIAGDHVRIAGPDGDAEAALERRIAEGRDFSRFAGIRPTVVVTVPVEQLLDNVADGAGPPAMLDGVVPIDPATARRLTANAPSLYRLLVDPHTGARLDLGRRRYEPSTELRMWLRLRDETCRFPGCGRLAKGCDLDHTVAWQHGGETRADNLAHLCRGHHTLKHATRWRMTQHPDGTITWRSPSGREHRTRAAS